MWFDIFKIQQGTFSTLVPKTLPKRRVSTPCRDRLNGIMDEIGNTIDKNDKVTMTSQDGSGFRELINTFNKNINTYPLFDRDKWDEVLPEPISVTFESKSYERNAFDETPEDVCCEFLKFLEESKKEAITIFRNDIDFTESFSGKYKDWLFSGNIKQMAEYETRDAYLTFNCGQINEIKGSHIGINFKLKYSKSGIKWTGDMHYEDLFSEEEFYKLWMSRKDSVINRRDEDTNEWMYADWLKKKEIHRWFANLDIMWWL
tara:strand:+ start:221 stop:997 length:777 start_codon:yes stop_codon:yes gene_type:complete